MISPTTPDFFADLSRRWQQQALSPADTSATWRTLLARGSDSPVAQMTRSAWIELIGGSLLTLPVIAVLLHLPGLAGRGLVAAVSVISAFSLWYYYRQLRALGRLQTVGTAMRAHAAAQLVYLRRLLRLSHNASLTVTAAAGGAMLYGLARHLAPHLPAPTADRLLLTVGLSVIVGLLITHWCIRWHNQRTYGRHLDQLEAILQELDEEPA